LVNVLTRVSTSIGTQIFEKYKGHLEILAARRMIWSQSHTEDPEILGATTQNVAAQATWHPGFFTPVSISISLTI